MSKFDIQPYFECHNRIFNVKIQYSAPVRMSKWDFKMSKYVLCQVLNAKMGFQMSIAIFSLSSNVKIGF